MIYLDNAATTFPKPEMVYRAVDDTQRSLAVNVGRGEYSLASKAAGVVDETRARLASFVGAYGPQCVVFTPSATLAANEIILGLEWDSLKNVYLTPFEHNAIARPLHKVCQENGLKEKFIAFDPRSHRWDKDETERLFLSSPPDYVFLNHISNVTGTILPVEQIAVLAKSHGATVIVDGSQSVGLIDYHLKNTSIDYLIFAGHKNLYSSFGVGGWISNGENKLQAFLAGGTGSDSLNLSMSNQQPIGYEPGSPNIIAISSLNASLKWLQETGQDTIANCKGRLMERLISGLSTLPVKAYLPAADVGHTSVVSFTHPEYEANEIGTILSLDYDIAVRTGYHCAPYIHDFIRTTERHGTVRVSVSYFNTEDDIDALIRALAEL